MKLNLTLQHGSKSSDHRLEIASPRGEARARGPREYVLDGASSHADCVPIAPGVYSILVGGRSYEVRVTAGAPHGTGESIRRIVTIGPRNFTIEIHDPRRRRETAAQADQSGPREILAPMPGKIVKILAEKNQEVAQGAGLLVIEAMKMQNELRAPRAGKVVEIYVTEGVGVETGARLVRLA